jgi:hypothetical protein
MRQKPELARYKMLMHFVSVLHFWTTKEIKKFQNNLKVEPVSKFIQNYCADWKDHTERMNSNIIPNKPFTADHMEKEAWEDS